MRFLGVLVAVVALSGCGQRGTCGDAERRIGAGVFASTDAPDLVRITLLPGEKAAKQVFTRNGRTYEVTYEIVTRYQGGLGPL